MKKSGPAPTRQLGTKRRHITAATSEPNRTNIPNHGDERRLRQTGQDTRGTRAESLLGDGARDLKRALYPARWNATCVPHDQSVGPVGLHGWEPPPGHSPQQVRNDAHADGRWEMGDGIRRWRRGAAISSSVGRLSTDSASVFRHFSTTTSNARHDGGCGGLVAGRSASGRDKGLSFAVAPSRLVTRCTSTRPSPRRKEQRWDRGQLDSPLCGGPGSVYLLRGVYVSSTGSWSPPPNLWRPLGRAASLGPTAYRPWFVGGQLPSVVQNAGHRSWPRRDQALPEARRPFLPAGASLSPPPSALMRISSSRGDGVLVNGDHDGPFRH